MITIDPAFLDLVRRSKVTKLREMFPREDSSHRSILQRARKGACVVHPGLKQFKDFLSALGPRPNDEWTVDRINPHDPEYAPGKVRWADKRQQANNRRNTVMLAGRDGTIRPLADWARATNQPGNSIRKRLERGFTHVEAIEGRRSSVGERAVPEVANSGWPNGATPNNWAPFYKPWLATFGNAPVGATKAAFCVWITRHRLKWYVAKLERKYPQYFLAEQADPECSEVPNGLANDPIYQQYLQHKFIITSSLKTMTRSELAFLKSVGHIVVTEPQRAAEVMKSRMRSQTS